MTQPIVVAAGARFDPLDIEASVLLPAGIEFRRTPALSADELIAGCKGATAILAAAQPKFTREVLEQLRGVRGIVRYGVGVDSIDLAAASEHGIVVCNVPDFGPEEVAFHSVTLIMALVRKLPQALAQTRTGIWDLSRLRPMHSPVATKVAVLGLGRIGRTAARYLAALGFEVLGYDPYVPAAALAAERIEVCATLDAILAAADVISLYLPVTAESRGLINASNVAKMKRGALLVNAARGELIDEAALLAALDDGRIAAAALDVVTKEPPGAQHPLLTHPNVIATPHAAWFTAEAETRLRRMTAEEALRLVRGEPPRNAVNPVS